MSTINQTAGPSRSVDNFTAIFQAALDEYNTVTAKALDTHPFATQLKSCDSPEAVSNVLRTQAQAFRRFRKGDEKLMAWLDPTINILYTFSGTLAEGIGLPFSPAKTIFTGVGVLLAAVKGVVASYNTLIHIFGRIHFFLQRLTSYTGMPLSKDFTELLGKIMSQILSILALSTKAMTEGRMKKFLTRLMGKTEIEDALLQLDSLTKEENLMAVAKTLKVTHHVDDNVNEIKVIAEGIDDKVKVIDRNVKAFKEQTGTDGFEGKQLQEKLRTWLSPPDHSINHNNACKTRLTGTSRWFIQGNTFRDWKENGSLLWIRGNPGAGKSVLCSAIINDIKNIRTERSASVAYHYFDYKDASKRHLCGLLASLIFQLIDDSDCCRSIIHDLYKSCGDGSEQPSDTDLARCINTIIKISGQLPIFIIMDALDECPNTTGFPSPRDEVLDFVDDLVRSNYSNLFICITSRPEQDIQMVLNPLTSASCRVVLHEESGQKEDIKNYVCSVVHKDRAMRRWKEEDKELVINTLTERAGGMFRWVYCQLDTLRRCFPSSIRNTLKELPETLDDTYERILEAIPKEKKKHAHRLFQCLVAAIRPLYVDELAEIFAIEFDQDAARNFKEGWRPEYPEEAVLSACSALITIIHNDDGDNEDDEDDNDNDEDYEDSDDDDDYDDSDDFDNDSNEDDDDRGSKIVQFSHFSVKEFLTSDRLQTSEVGSICHYHISLTAAHTILAEACLTVLLQLDGKIDKKRLATFPLAYYAAQYWFDHAKYEDVESRVQASMEKLFNPGKPYLASWVWIHNMDYNWYLNDLNTIETIPDHPSVPKATALYYAVSCGLCCPAKYLISTHGEDVNAKCGALGTPLHAASIKGHLDAVSLLLDQSADVNMTNKYGKTALCAAYDGGHLDVMRLLLEHGAAPDVKHDLYGLIIHDASCRGQAKVVRLLLQHKADVNAPSISHWTPLHWASLSNRANIAQILLDHGANINAISDSKETPLFHASEEGCLSVARLLLARGADVHIRTQDARTPLHAALNGRHLNIAFLLLDHGADANITDRYGRPPLCVAYDGRHLDVMRLLLERGAAPDVRYDSIGLIIHDASCRGQAKVVRLLLQHKADVNAPSISNWTPLHWASLSHRTNIAQILLDHGANINAISDSGETPLFHASEEGCLDVVRLLLARGADVHIRTQDARTPFKAATSKKHTRIAQLLLEYGAEKE